MSLYKKGLFKKGDVVIIVFLIIASFFPHLIFSYKHHMDTPNMDSVKYAVVRIDGKEVDRFDLGKSKSIIKTYYPANGQYNIIEIKEGRARVKEDNSPDQIAVKTGWISKPGQISVCLPHKLVVEISQNESSDYYIY